MAKKHAKKPTFVGLFCGCGGFDLGFESAGYLGLGAFDNDANAVAVYNENHSTIATVIDLASAVPAVLERPDVVVAGPPCQGFSTLGKRRMDDPRNSLLVRATSLALDLEPRVIAIENVTGAVTGSIARHYRTATRLMSEAGYQWRLLKIAASDFNLPQIRKRIVILAARKSLDTIAPPNRPAVCRLGDCLNRCTKANHDPTILNEDSDGYKIARRIEPHQKLCNVRAGARAVPTWQIPEVFGRVTKREQELLELIRKLRRQRRLRDSGDADPVAVADLREFVNWCPEYVLRSLQDKGYVKSVGDRHDFTHAFNGKFRRLSYNHLSPAVDTRFGEPRYFLHPTEHRGLSAREAARIQGFPDDFVFAGTRVQQYTLVGNAVPPAVGVWLANEIREKLL